MSGVLRLANVQSLPDLVIQAGVQANDGRRAVKVANP